jgi:hypothetical protein
VFLFIHWNIHHWVAGVLSGDALNGRMAYGREVDYCDAMPCLMFYADQPFPNERFVGNQNANQKGSEMNPKECC